VVGGEEEERLDGAGGVKGEGRGHMEGRVFTIEVFFLFLFMIITNSMNHHLSLIRTLNQLSYPPISLPYLPLQPSHLSLRLLQPVPHALGVLHEGQ